MLWLVRAWCVTPRVTRCRGQIYNGRLRGFGDCGEVEKGVPPKSVADRCMKAQNNYSSTIHALVSAVKKLQRPERGYVCVRKGDVRGSEPTQSCSDHGRKFTRAYVSMVLDSTYN